MSISRILVTCPDYDITTRYLSAWAKDYIQIAETRNQKPYVLKAKDVNKQKFHGMIRKNKPELVLLNGHGNDRCVTGHDSKPIVSITDASILSGSSVYALSCSSAVLLGDVAMKSGAIAYIGYDKEFIMVCNTRMTSNPIADETAKLFLEPSNAIATSLIKGHTATEAVNKGKKEFAKKIIQALNSDVQSDDDKYVPYLIWNLNSLVSC